MLLGWKNPVKMAILPKAIYWFNVIAIKLPIFHRTRTNILKFVWNRKRPRIAIVVLRKKKKNRRLTLPDFRQSFDYKATVMINSVILAQKQIYGPMKQNRDPRNKPKHLWSINLWQRRQEYKMEKRQISSAGGAGKAEQLHIDQRS